MSAPTHRTPSRRALLASGAMPSAGLAVGGGFFAAPSGPTPTVRHEETAAAMRAVGEEITVEVGKLRPRPLPGRCRPIADRG